MTRVRRNARMTSHNHRFTPAIQTLRHYIKLQITESYRLWSIQLSKIRRGISSLVELSARDAFPLPEPLWLTNSQGPIAPRRSFALNKSAGLFVPAKAHRTRRKLGGEYRARTGDLLDANQALSQLS